MNAVASARRLLLAAGVTFVVGLPLLACSGAGTDGSTDGATDNVEAPQPEGPSSRLVGTWRMVPDESTLRMLKIVDAALSGKPKKKEKLGKLTADEEKLFKEWENKKGDEAKLMKNQIKFTKNCQFDFTDKQVTVQFGTDETFGPVDYEVVSSTDSNTTIKFDPGIGNGTETHSFEWSGPNKGIDHITGADGKEFFPLDVSKR